MPPTPKYANETLNAAIEAVKSGKSVYGTAKFYNIPQSSLRWKISNDNKEIVSKSKILYDKSILTEEEEKQLYEWVKDCAEKGHPRTASQIRSQAQRIVEAFPRANSFPNNYPSRTWLTRFLKRCNDLHKKKCVHISVAASLVTEKSIRMYHERVTQQLKKGG